MVEKGKKRPIRNSIRNGIDVPPLSVEKKNKKSKTERRRQVAKEPEKLFLLIITALDNKNQLILGRKIRKTVIHVSEWIRYPPLSHTAAPNCRSQLVPFYEINKFSIIKTNVLPSEIIGISNPTLCIRYTNKVVKWPTLETLVEWRNNHPIYRRMKPKHTSKEDFTVTIYNKQQSCVSSTMPVNYQHSPHLVLYIWSVISFISCYFLAWA